MQNFFPTFYYAKQKQQWLIENAVDSTLAPADFVIMQNAFEEKRRNATIRFDNLLQKTKKTGSIIDSLPLIFICGSLICALVYDDFVTFNSLKGIHENVYGSHIPIIGLYLGIFVFAETAFILMAIKEYLQDLLHISDEALMLSIFS